MIRGPGSRGLSSSAGNDATRDVAQWGLLFAFRFHRMLLSPGKRHRCPQIASREWEVRGTSPSKEEGAAERRKTRLGSKNA
ncbi:MAG TPA: hypothetical protein VN838_17500, partial [Bradyrhizobium sp.]|nr:hypothetical protein [Bradyrhizobium sp.]